MIEFNGKLSDECFKFSFRKRNIASGLMILILNSALFLSVFTLAIIFKNWQYAIPLLGMLILITIGAFVVPYKRVEVLNFSKTIIVENDAIFFTVFGGKSDLDKRSIDKVKKVVDYGKWYIIYFKRGDDTSSLVCEKNLIIKGTLQEFEEIFRTKLLKKQDFNIT